MNDVRSGFSSRIGFTLATIGAAVGIGSIWKFPYEVGANGGGAFLILYFAGLAIVVFPLMLAEFAIGKKGAADAVSSLRNVANEHGASQRWTAIGLLGALAIFLILSFYAVIGGWTIHYAVDTAIHGLGEGDSVSVQLRYDTFLANPVRMAAYLFVFLGVTALIVARGVANGIEMASLVLMPLLILLLVALAWYSATRGDLSAALDFLFTPDWAGVTANVALEAIGLGFFSIGVGLGMMITYAAYAQPHIKLGRIALISIVADTVISIIAGIAVFPIVFAHALDPAGGAGLVFVTLPVAFAAMPAGQWAATAFFAMLVIAALGSAVAMLEVVTTVLMQWRDWRRVRACLVGVTACAATAIPTVLSFNLLSGWFPLGGLSGFESATFFDVLDFATSNLMLPLGGLLIALFAAWIMRPGFLQDALSLQRMSALVLRFVLRFVVPVVLVAVVIARFGA